MGHLLYGRISAERIDLDDRTLAHLQIAVATKLRRGERFWIEFVHGVDEGGGRVVIWIDHAVPLVFHYVSGRLHETDREWVENMMTQANDQGRIIISSSRCDA
ncbi:MAG: ATP-dependent ligase [Microbacteriaceae bacterium]|jgi:hypothetical protein|nr:ATP-dependent ligase [Microbacteriaceae bacterium]